MTLIERLRNGVERYYHARSDIVFLDDCENPYRQIDERSEKGGPSLPFYVDEHGQVVYFSQGLIPGPEDSLFFGGFWQRYGGFL